MATGKFGDHFSIDVMADGRHRVLGAACRLLSDNGREVQTDEIQVEIFITKAEFLSSSGKAILDKLREECASLAASEKATDVQKRFVGLTLI